MNLQRRSPKGMGMSNRIMTWLIVAGLGVNVALMALHAVLVRRTQIYHEGQLFPPITGIRLDDTESASVQPPCVLIRITSDDCRFCKLDYPAYAEIAVAAAANGCELFAIAPVSGQMAPSASERAQQLKYVSMELGEALYPKITPQTILLDRDRRATWLHVGAMNKSEVDRAITAIAVMTRPR
jgi:hypothetical protein